MITGLQLVAMWLALGGAGLLVLMLTAMAMDNEPVARWLMVWIATVLILSLALLVISMFGWWTLAGVAFVAVFAAVVKATA